MEALLSLLISSRSPKGVSGADEATNDSWDEEVGCRNGAFTVHVSRVSVIEFVVEFVEQFLRLPVNFVDFLVQGGRVGQSQVQVDVTVSVEINDPSQLCTNQTTLVPLSQGST